MSDLGQWGQVDDLLEAAADIAEKVDLGLQDDITEVQGKLRARLMEAIKDGEI